MKKLAPTIVLILIACSSLIAQTDSSSTTINLDEFMAETEDTVKLLPDRILFTQALFWGNKGLMRNFSYFELTPEKRQRELKLRRNMLGIHQILGFATLGGMIAQGFVGAKLYKDPKYKDTHEMLAAGVNISYFTTASLALFAPPKMLKDSKGLSSIKLHKYLGVIHLSSMIATNILAGPASSDAKYKPYHRAFAYTAFGAFAASMIVITF